VLAGTIGSLMAQRLAPFDAACLGVWLHGRAGERVSERLGNSGLIASDLPYEIAVARHELAATRAATSGS
jgi:NAD(P)H-hydrate epimerase